MQENVGWRPTADQELGIWMQITVLTGGMVTYIDVIAAMEGATSMPSSATLCHRDLKPSCDVLSLMHGAEHQWRWERRPVAAGTLQHGGVAVSAASRHVARRLAPSRQRQESSCDLCRACAHPVQRLLPRITLPTTLASGSYVAVRWTATPPSRVAPFHRAALFPSEPGHAAMWQLCVSAPT